MPGSGAAGEVRSVLPPTPKKLFQPNPPPGVGRGGTGSSMQGPGNSLRADHWRLVLPMKSPQDHKHTLCSQESHGRRTLKKSRLAPSVWGCSPAQHRTRGCILGLRATASNGAKMASVAKGAGIKILHLANVSLGTWTGGEVVLGSQLWLCQSQTLLVGKEKRKKKKRERDHRKLSGTTGSEAAESNRGRSRSCSRADAKGTLLRGCSAVMRLLSKS